MDNQPIVAGIDAGSQTTKVAIVQKGYILGWSVVCGFGSTVDESRGALDKALQNTDLDLGRIQSIAATGVGRAQVQIAREQVSDVMALAKGINVVLPSARIVLDIGARKALAVKCNKGNPVDFAINDKCAAGTGRFLEKAADILRLTMEEMGQIPLNAIENLDITSTCSVFAESEIISLVHRKKIAKDIICAVFKSLSLRIAPLLTRIGAENSVAMVGGVARIKGMVEAMEETIGCKILVPENPQIIAALGAAIICEERYVQCSSAG